MKQLLALAPACALLAACATNPAEDPVQLRLGEIDARVGKVERVISNQSLLDLARRIDALEAQQRELRGNGELLQNSADGLRKQQRDLYADLDRRLATLEGNWRAGGSAAATGSAAGGSATAPAGAPVAAGGAAVAVQGAAPAAAAGAPPAAAVGGGDEAGAYARAFDLMKSGDYAGAIARFTQQMKDYPQGQLADNAQYWIGEAHYVMHEFEQAETAFRAVGERWPNSRKAPDALLKLGYTQLELRRGNDGRNTLGQVVQRFPGSDAARLAAERLSRQATEPR